jgi:Inner centromere protein, ARK binding region
MAQYANGGKIPFADAPNPPAHNTKTPASAYHHKTLQLVKSSPQYPNGEAIHLPEIATDSEDEDSGDEGNAFPVPDWATPGHLTDQLIRQEGIDGDAVFGPIAPLRMEEIFTKSNKERLKRMRERTSSANWAISGDGLTLEEVRADREQRERMRLEGGWRYGS